MGVFRKKSAEELIAKYHQTKDEQYLNILIRDSCKMIMGVCLTYLKNIHDAEDACAEVCEIIVKECRKGTEIEFFKAWLGQVIRNYCLRVAKGKKRSIKFKENLKANSTAESMHFDMELSLFKENNDDPLDILHQSIGKLSEDQQLCIKSFYLEKMSYQDICDKYDMNYNQVRTALQNGRRNLKKYFK